MTSGSRHSVARPPTIIDLPSPNHDGRGGAAIDMVVVHYTGMPTAEAALARLTDAAAKVSAHYVITEPGAVYRLVAEDRRAWHAGLACWAGRRDVNGCSIGIELVNPGHEFGYRRFPSVQIAALERLGRDILERHRIPPARVLGHSDVAPERKIDPGELFDWQQLAAAGIGLWPAADFAISANGPGLAPELAPGATGAAVLDLQIALAGIGYDVAGTGAYDPAFESVVAAFQRHFRQARVDGAADRETIGLIYHLLDRMA